MKVLGGSGSPVRTCAGKKRDITIRKATVASLALGCSVDVGGEHLCPEGLALAGRVAKGIKTGCMVCHANAKGGDYIFANDKRE